MMKHVTVAYDKTKWCAVPANNGGNGPTWQWDNELLVGFTQGEASFTRLGHQVSGDHPYLSRLARSLDGGESWQAYVPTNYQGDAGFRMENAVALTRAVDFTAPGFAMRVEGYGYHGNAGQQWFYSLDKGKHWKGPFTFGTLLQHPELADKQFTGRTAYIVSGKHDCFLFLSGRSVHIEGLKITNTDKVFLAHTTDGGKTFSFVSWVVPPSDESRAVMPAPVRVSATKMVVAIRRRNDPLTRCWIDCYHSEDNGQSWAFLSKVGDTGNIRTNGNPPAMVRLADGRLCCVYGDRDRAVMLARLSSDDGKTWGPEIVLRDGLKSINGFADLGYPRLFQRPDGKLVAAYFWCSPDKPETHIEATIFDAP